MLGLHPAEALILSRIIVGRQANDALRTLDAADWPYLTRGNRARVERRLRALVALGQLYQRPRYSPEIEAQLRAGRDALIAEFGPKSG